MVYPCKAKQDNRFLQQNTNKMGIRLDEANLKNNKKENRTSWGCHSVFYLNGKNTRCRCVQQLAIRSALRYATVCPVRALLTIAQPSTD